MLRAILDLAHEIYERATSEALYAYADKIAALDQNDTGVDDWLAKGLRKIADRLKAKGR